MKIYKKTIFTTILFLICMTNTFAACTQEEINEFKKIENQYKITYEFNKDTKDYTLFIEAGGSDKYRFSTNSEEILQNCQVIDENKTNCYNVPKGEYTLEIVGRTETCQSTLKEIKIKLKGYNKFYNDPACEGIEEFVLCQETYDKEIEYETFLSRVNTYKKTKEKDNENKNNIKVEKENKILEYAKNHLFEIIIIAIFIILSIITIVITTKSIKKSRRLE